MKKIKRVISAGIFFSLIFFFYIRIFAQKKTLLIDEFQKKAGIIDVKEFFKETTLDDATILVNSKAILRQVDVVLDYFQKYKKEDPTAVNIGVFFKLGVTLLDVESTMQFVKDIIKEDIKKGTRFRLYDPQFFRKHFRIIRWFPYGGDPAERNKIRITKYAVFTIKGSNKKNSIYKYALYRLPEDERGMSLREAEKQKQLLYRFKYTKQQVLAGAYDKGGAKPLAWVTREGLEEALMEGSICVELPGEERRYFNVNRNNGIPYDPVIKNPREQARYWYFGRVSQPQGYGMDVKSQVPIFAGVAFAADVYNLGLGKLMGIFYTDTTDGKNKMRLGILTDTGGAFYTNLHQLDYYMGVFPSHLEFKRKIKTLPKYAEVYFFIKK